MNGEAATDLVRKLEKSIELLPHFDEEKFRHVVEESEVLFRRNCTDVETLFEDSANESSGLHTTFHWRHAVLERNKRCLMAYCNLRLKKIRAMRWEFGSVLPPDIRYNMSALENQWLKQYSTTLARYMSSVGNGLDLTQNRHPPRSLNVEVRCLKDYGEFETQDGTVILLKKDTQHYLLLSESETLIKQGIVEHVLS